MTDQPDWPARRPIPELPPAAWPAGDREALVPDSPQRPGPFAKKRAAARTQPAAMRWRPATRRNVEKAYGKWLAYLGAVEPGALDAPPADRVTEARCERYLAALAASGLAVSSQAFHLGHLAMAVRAIAPAGDWTWLTDAASWLRTAAAPVRDKRSRTVAIADLYRLGIAMMDGAAPPGADRGRLLRYRDGLILALWAARPWRVGTFAALDVDRHLDVSDHAVAVTFDAGEMKTEVARHWTVPAHLVAYMTTYLDDVRWRLPTGRRHGGLWPSAKGGRLSSDGLAGVLTRHTQPAFGIAVHPHAVRYSAATSAAMTGPAAARLVMAVLGHSDPRTSLDYYVLARRVDAARKTTASLETLKHRIACEHRPERGGAVASGRRSGGRR